MHTVTPSTCAAQPAVLGPQMAAALARIAPEARPMLLALAEEMGVRYPNQEVKVKVKVKMPQRRLRLVVG